MPIPERVPAAAVLNRVRGHAEAACVALGLDPDEDTIYEEDDHPLYDLYTALAHAIDEAKALVGAAAGAPEPTPDPALANDCVQLAMAALGEPDGDADLGKPAEPLHEVLVLLSEVREELYDLQPDAV